MAVSEAIEKPKRLTGKQASAVVALLSTSTIAQASAVSGVAERTLFRWLQDPTFQEAYRAARRESVSQAIAGVQQAASLAVDTLKLVMRCPFSPVPSKVSAAKTVLELAVKAVELEDLTARIEALEERLT